MGGSAWRWLLTPATLRSPILSPASGKGGFKQAFSRGVPMERGHFVVCLFLQPNVPMGREFENDLLNCAILQHG